jgi:uncharacterized surface protein with fasciclin (FAS1) repeats
MKIKGGGCACNCRGFDPNESKCDCYGRQKPICNVGGRRACGRGKFVASCYYGCCNSHNNNDNCHHHNCCHDDCRDDSHHHNCCYDDCRDDSHHHNCCYDDCHDDTRHHNCHHDDCHDDTRHHNCHHDDCHDDCRDDCHDDCHDACHYEECYYDDCYDYHDNCHNFPENIGGCEGTQYGCCPDGITSSNSDGSNCPSLKCNILCKNTKTLATVFEENPDLSILKKILEFTELVEILQTNEYTLFAPENEAFERSLISESSIDLLKNLNNIIKSLISDRLDLPVIKNIIEIFEEIKSIFSKILLQHVILNGVIYDCNLINFQVAQPADGDDIQFFINNKEIFIRVDSDGLQRVSKVSEGIDRNICVKDNEKATIHKINNLLGTIENYPIKDLFESLNQLEIMLGELSYSNSELNLTGIKDDISNIFEEY